MPLDALAAIDLDRHALAVIAAWYFVFVVSTVLHEAAHALVAWKLGDPTAYEGGQVTINPLPHIAREPFGMVLAPLLSLFLSNPRWVLGWASAPYDPNWALRHPSRAALMAMAGPASNLVLAILAGTTLHIGLAQGVFEAPRPGEGTFEQIVVAVDQGIFTGTATLLSILFSLNLILFAFNILPLPPLDGSAIVPLLVTTESAAKFRHYTSQPAVVLIGMMVAWNLFPRFFVPIFRHALNLIFAGI